MHGQWDWMNDPEIHSSNWEWDTAQPAEQWKHSHNYVHHQFTNVLGYDNDIGYGILRMAREQKWSPYNLGQPVYNSLLAVAVRVGRRAARPRHRADPQGREGSEGDEAAAQADLPQGPQPDPQGLRRLPGAGGPAVEDSARRQRHLEHHPQPVVLRDHLLRPLPGRRDALHRGGDRGRVALGVVPPADPRRRELRGRPAAAHPVAATSASRSSTTSTPTCRATGTPRSQCGSASCARSTTCRTPPGRSTGSTARRCARSSSCRCRTPGPAATSRSRPPRRATAGAESDSERPHRRRELGGWSRAGAAARA